MIFILDSVIIIFETRCNMTDTLKTGFKKIKTVAVSNILTITFVISNLINAVIVRSMTIGKAFYIKPLLADLTIILLVGAFSYFFKPKNRFKYFAVWSVIFTLVCLINGIYYKNYVSFASFSLLSTLSELKDYGDAVVNNILDAKDFIYLWQLFCLFIFN